MDFVPENYGAIRQALEDRSSIDLIVPVEATQYHLGQGPDTWEICPPAGSKESYSLLLSLAGTSPSGIFIAIALLVDRDSGEIHYKSAGNGKVLARVSWPTPA